MEASGGLSGREKEKKRKRAAAVWGLSQQRVCVRVFDIIIQTLRWCAEREESEKKKTAEMTYDPSGNF